MPSDILLVDKVYEVMARQGFKTRRDLARAAGIHETNIGTIVDGEIRAIRMDTLEGLCRALDCQPGDLLEYVPDGTATSATRGPLCASAALPCHPEGGTSCAAQRGQ